MMQLVTKKSTIGELLADAQSRLAPRSESAQLDAQVLLAHVLGRERSWLLAHAQEQMAHELEPKWEAALARLERGEPLPYVLGEWEFYGIKFHVTPDVLIPRPETELLVETALEWLRAHPGRRRAADVGTGCGCIAVALAANVADLQIEASDISPAALEIARQNIERYGLQDRVHLHQSDLLSSAFASPQSGRSNPQDSVGDCHVGLRSASPPSQRRNEAANSFSNLSTPFDLICANLPYIPSTRAAELAVARHEPHVALFAGADGLDLIGRLLEQAGAKLAPGGLLLAEIDESQENSAPELARRNFPDAKIDMLRDLADKPRLLVIEN
jgi:release factor glutamine methyltransferase